jgi:NhaP-type Na+/H+ or K+/H+ antiporter
MEGSFALTVLMITAIVAGVTAQVVANYIRVPSIVFLLIFGVMLGGNGLGILQPRDLGMGLEVIVSLSVALILFEGGLNLQLSDLDKVSASLRNLVTTGALITLIGGAIAAYWLAEFPWQIAFLYASLVVVTGPTVINPLLKEVGVDRRVATILEGEGVLIDALGAILAVVVLDVVLKSDASTSEIVLDLLVRLGIGGGIGAAGGWLLSGFLKRSQFLADDLKSSVVVAAVLGLFGLAQSIQSESGLMTAVLAGIVVRASAVPDERLLLKFKGQLTVLAVSVLFVLLAANLSIPSIFVLGWGGVQTVAVLMLIVRPLNVIVCTWNSSFTWRQKAFIAWCGPRGIVAASVASLFAIVLTDRGVNGGDSIKALVFLTIAMTVFLQGLTAKWVAKLLGLRVAKASGVVIVGGNPLGLLVARLFQSNGQKVTLVDTSAESCKQAIALGIPAFVSNGLDMRALAEAGLDSVGTFIALTINTDVNLVLAQRAMEEFRPPKVFAVYVKEDSNHQDIQQAFGNRVPIKSWNQYVSLQEIRLGEVTLAEETDLQLSQFNNLYNSGNLLPIVFERKERLQIVPAEIAWESGDRIIYLLYTPKMLGPSPLQFLSGSEQAKDWESSSPTIDVIPEAIPLEVKPGQKQDRLNDTQDYLAMAREILKKSGRTPSP